MAEIAGTLVGIISLSIQICGGLTGYIDSVKHASSTAEQISAEMDHLADQLENLDSVVKKLDSSHSAVLTQKSVIACANAIQHVREKLGEYRPNTSSGLRASFKAFASRLKFPFKESDINYWRGVVSSIQQNLQIALDTLSIDLHRIDSVSTNQAIERLSQEYQAGYQNQFDYQSSLHTRTTELLFHQHDLITTGQSTLIQRIDSLHRGVKDIQRAVVPTDVDVSQTSMLSVMLSQLTRLVGVKFILEMQVQS
ncbi:hypothetical protein ACN47E_004081 [Coniothyrium glycines]